MKYDLVIELTDGFKLNLETSKKIASVLSGVVTGPGQLKEVLIDNPEASLIRIVSKEGNELGTITVYSDEVLVQCGVFTDEVSSALEYSVASNQVAYSTVNNDGLYYLFGDKDSEIPTCFYDNESVRHIESKIVKRRIAPSRILSLVPELTKYGIVPDKEGTINFEGQEKLGSYLLDGDWINDAFSKDDQVTL